MKAKQLTIINYQSAITNVIKYFSFFNYPPTFDEIYVFIKKKTSKSRLTSILEEMEKKGAIKSQINSLTRKLSNSITETRYTLGEYSTRLQSGKFQISNFKFQMGEYKKKYKISQQKLDNFRFQLYVWLLSFFPQIQLVGLSGTLSMMNANENDDIDLFIITAKNRLFTGRFISMILAKLLGIKRKRDEAKANFSLSRGPAEGEVRLSCDKICIAESHRHKDKVCLNLFFDETNMTVPKRKQTEYVGHEVLQMKALVNKNHMYERFLVANRWVFDIFPNSEFIVQNSEFNLQLKIINSKLILNSKFIILNYIFDNVENLLKRLQLMFINRHRTTEIITNHQLWFFPDDFEKKIRDLAHSVKPLPNRLG